MSRTYSKTGWDFTHLAYRRPRLVAALLLLSLSLPLHASEQSLQSLYNFQIRMAAQGSSEAMIKLGEMHEDGLGTEKNDERALEWYQKALSNGHAEAQSHIDSLHKKQQEAVMRQRAEQARAAREQAAREQAARDEAARLEALREQAAHDEAARLEALREQAARDEAAHQEAVRKAMTPEEKARAREEAIRRAETAYQQSLQKQLKQEQAESDALKRSRNAAAVKKH